MEARRHFSDRTAFGCGVNAACARDLVSEAVDGAGQRSHVAEVFLGHAELEVISPVSV